MSQEVFLVVFPMWVHAFFFTLAVEVPIFWAISTRDRTVKSILSLRRRILAGAAGTCITHPLFWFVWPFIVRDYQLYILSGEILVTAVEIFTFAYLARPLQLRYAVAASIAANAGSYFLGLLF